MSGNCEDLIGGIILRVEWDVMPGAQKISTLETEEPDFFQVNKNQERVKWNIMSSNAMSKDYLFEVEREAEIVGIPLTSLLGCVLCPEKRRGLNFFIAVKSKDGQDLASRTKSLKGKDEKMIHYLHVVNSSKSLDLEVKKAPQSIFIGRWVGICPKQFCWEFFLFFY